MVIRAAVPQEADRLTELALRSKAVWGYSESFMARCRPLLTLTTRYIETTPTFVAVDEDVCGFYSLKQRGGEVELDLLFVEPAKIRRGVGAELLAHARQQARALGYARLIIESDPDAEGFYVRAGARRIGTVASTVEENRLLPVLELALV